MTGAVWYNPFTTSIYTFPTFEQNKSFTQSATEDSPNDESISFNTSEGAGFSADLAIRYVLDAEKIPNIFASIRQDSEYIRSTYMRNELRDSLVNKARTLTASDIIGPKGSELMHQVRDDMNEKLKEKGITVQLVTFIGKLRVDGRFEQAINASIEASQNAIAAENKVRQIEAEARQATEKAKGEAAAILEKAKAEAEATLARATAEAEGNKLIAASLTPELVKYQAMRSWDGKLPIYQGMSAPIPFIDLNTKLDTE